MWRRPAFVFSRGAAAPPAAVLLWLKQLCVPPLQLHRPVCHCRTCSMALCWLSDITCRLCANYTEMVEGGWSVICNVFLLFVCLFKMQVSVMPCMCTTHPWDLSSPLTLFPCYMKSVCCENTHTHSYTGQVFSSFCFCSREGPHAVAQQQLVRRKMKEQLRPAGIAITSAAGLSFSLSHTHTHSNAHQYTAFIFPVLLSMF